MLIIYRFWIFVSCPLMVVENYGEHNCCEVGDFAEQRYIEIS